MSPDPVPAGRYRTIVVDPPWDHSDGTGRNYGERDFRGTGRGEDRHTFLPYAVMSVKEIAALPVRELAMPDAHLYLWTTNRWLRSAYDVAEGWGFSPVKPLVWCKEPMGFFGGTFTSSVEFVLFCRRGQLASGGRVGRQWFTWPRSRHSAKPEPFFDLVERASPGPVAELFARRSRLGWEYPIGDEALGGAAAPRDVTLTR